jgi:hypothetical protein
MSIILTKSVGLGINILSSCSPGTFKVFNVWFSVVFLDSALVRSKLFVECLLRILMRTCFIAANSWGCVKTRKWQV